MIHNFLSIFFQQFLFRQRVNDYISEAEFNLDPYTATIEEINQSNGKIFRLIDAIYGSDPMFKSVKDIQKEFGKGLVDLGIKVGASIITTGVTFGAGELLSPVVATVVSITANSAVEGASSIATDVLVNDKSMNDKSIYKNAINKMGESIYSDVTGGIIGSVAGAVGNKVAENVSEVLLSETAGDIAGGATTIAITSVINTLNKDNNASETLINGAENIGKHIVLTYAFDKMKINDPSTAKAMLGITKALPNEIINKGIKY